MSALEPDSESDQIREVYARFGLAVYHAQCVERWVAILLSTAFNPTFALSTPAERDWTSEVEFKKTLGRLVSGLKLKVTLSSDLESRLTNAVDLRNRLAHRYFWERALQFQYSDGREAMIKELVGASEELAALDQILSDITTRWGRQIGVTPEAIEAHMEKLTHGEQGV